MGWPRPPAARISFLLPRTSRGKAAPFASRVATRVGSPTQRGSHAAGALYSFACHASPRSLRTRRARQVAACVRGAPASAAGVAADCKTSPPRCQLGGLRLSVHRRRQRSTAPSERPKVRLVCDARSLRKLSSRTPDAGGPIMTSNEPRRVASQWDALARGAEGADQGTRCPLLSAARLKAAVIRTQSNVRSGALSEKSGPHSRLQRAIARP